ncbi:Mitochondrial inner membrane protease ATP23 [Fusarium oxysporum f. sp. cubense]|uniref:Mitochondrial inner membrane protease ATP23 n=1 Tax=Fusarium oxysporum f. sp. cubense TaxID=61366 RepID=A0A559LWL2_FUSOC|nr:Mitochondrial inner membrane protease ATP23 [Fusarium oxysporum f. sp. cubense]
MSSDSTPPPGVPAGTPSASNAEIKNYPAKTGFSPEISWWMNYFKMLSGQMTPEGKFFFREYTTEIEEEKDCKACERDRDWLFTYSPVVRFMSEKIQALNGRIDPSNVHCRRCPSSLRADGSVNWQSGGFSPNHGILICANHIKNRKHLEDTLAHEMVHAWDYVRWKNVDFMGQKDLKHAACTEIRASMLSGECRWTKEAFVRGNWRLTQQFQNCVRRRAIDSVTARSTCKDDVQATKVVNQVWDSCFADTRPFDEVYR